MDFHFLANIASIFHHKFDYHAPRSSSQSAMVAWYIESDSVLFSRKKGEIEPESTPVWSKLKQNQNLW